MSPPFADRHLSISLKNMDEEQLFEERMSAVATLTLWLGMALGIAAGFVAGVYWPY